MNLHSLLNPRYWGNRAIDTYWLWRAKTNPSPDYSVLNWPMNRDLLREVTVNWPATYGWAPFEKWGEPLRAALTRFATLRFMELPQPYRGVISFTISYRGRTFRINVECSDYLDLNEQAYQDA